MLVAYNNYYKTEYKSQDALNIRVIKTKAHIHIFFVFDMLIVIRCYCFWMVVSQGGESLLIIYEIAFKTSLENLLHGNKCSRYTWPGKASRCEADTDARGSRPRPRYPCAPVIGYTCARAETQPGARRDCPGWAVHMTPRGTPRWGRGSFRIWGSQDGELASVQLLFVVYRRLVTRCCRFLALTSHTGQT